MKKLCVLGLCVVSLFGGLCACAPRERSAECDSDSRQAVFAHRDELWAQIAELRREEAEIEKALYSTGKSTKDACLSSEIEWLKAELARIRNRLHMDGNASSAELCAQKEELLKKIRACYAEKIELKTRGAEAFPRSADELRAAKIEALTFELRELE